MEEFDPVLGTFTLADPVIYQGLGLDMDSFLSTHVSIKVFLRSHGSDGRRWAGNLHNIAKDFQTLVDQGFVNRAVVDLLVLRVLVHGIPSNPIKFYLDNRSRGCIVISRSEVHLQPDLLQEARVTLELEGVLAHHNIPVEYREVSRSSELIPSGRVWEFRSQT